MNSCYGPTFKNTYHLHVLLFVFDMVRMFQDHPKYKNGLKQQDLVELLQQEHFANGDLESQIETAVKSLEHLGYLRFIEIGYQTLGPYSRISIAKAPKQRIKAWQRIQNDLY